MAYDADVIVIGAGLAGLTAAAELADAGRRVIILEQEPEASLGGQAHWSFGGLFLVGSPEQRRLGIRDSRDLAWQDWLGSAGFDRPEDDWARRWAEAYVDFAAGEKRAWLRRRGLRFFPVVGWAERGGHDAAGHGNSVPRFHITWGTGPGVLEPFERRVREAAGRGLVDLRFRHRVTGLARTAGALDTVTGEVLAPSAARRGTASNRQATDAFELRAQAVLITSGGIGGNHDLVRAHWPRRLGTPPAHLLSGVPAHVDGLLLGIAQRAGARLVNGDRMWHYTEGITNWDPVWSAHGIRILPGPSALWLDATGHRLPVPFFPGFDTLGTLEHILRTGHDHTWFVLTRKIVEKEFALSGSEQNPDLTGRSVRDVLGRVRAGAPGPVRAFLDHGPDFVVERRLDDLVRGMNALTGRGLVDAGVLRRQIEARDRDLGHRFGKDLQLAAIRRARGYLGDRLIRVAAPHRVLDPAAGPLIAVRLHVLTRKTLGGLQTDLSGRVLTADGQPLPGLYAAGEAAGFGGGGMHGYRSLEGTFLGGCLFSGRTAGRAAARAL
ncbi:FAD-binding dehydrogenase [Streptomyces marincola]|uniref:FAD-binding dehydrogenase n=1 Tax=Streptomyces marincola TaxID=2878388 RepID=A0A1W7D3P3_9ACTN|nr:FAD-binding dehydrogenase [Streptomyces marincola]ARQ71539.1 FAD-binding dehydrogenase [Streptomyces marincola]